MSETRSAVLAALLEARGAAVSGEALAAASGVSRAAIAKHVATLKADGMPIVAESGVGYALDPRRLLTPAGVERLVRTPLRVIGGGPTLSTMDDARTIAQDGVANECAVIATSQADGRGRQGRAWSSPPGGVYVTLVLVPDLALAEAVSAPLAVSVGLARAFETLGADAALKWPNDVFVRGAKVAGILTEVSAEADRVRHLLVGIGINVYRPSEPAPGAAYLADVIERPSLEAVAAIVIDAVREIVDEVARDGFERVREEYRARLMWAGAPVRVTAADGSLIAEGILADVDDVGRLVLEADGVTIVLSAGDVSLRAAE